MNQKIAMITSESAANPPTAPPMIAPRLLLLEGESAEGEDKADVLEGESAEELDSVVLIDEIREPVRGTMVVSNTAFSCPR
jgi:hypothetical protein